MGVCGSVPDRCPADKVEKCHNHARQGARSMGSPGSAPVLIVRIIGEDLSILSLQRHPSHTYLTGLMFDDEIQTFQEWKR